MPCIKKACIAPKKVLCSKRGPEVKISDHGVIKCLGESCRYQIIVDQVPSGYLSLIASSQGS